MSTLTSTSVLTIRPVAGPVTPARVLRSEWIKLRSLRSTWWTVLVMLVLSIGVGVLVTTVAAGQGHPSTRASTVAVRGELGNLLSQLAVGVLATLMITGEYGTGMISSSLTAVPRRLPVLAAKLGVFTAVLFPLTLASSLAAFGLSQVVWRAHGYGSVGLGEPGVARVVVGVALSLVVSGVVAFALGTLVRNTAAALTTFVGVFFVLPTLVGVLPERLADLGKFLPLNAGDALWGTALTANPLSPWTGFALLCGYAAVLLTAAAVRLRRGDV